MGNINFVPDDYIQNNESRRANFVCVILFVIVMAALIGSFTTIKIRQRECIEQEASVNARMSDLQEAIKQFEQLQVKRKEMMKTALMTAELIEPVPRSIVLAALTNNLPPGASLGTVTLKQEMPMGDSKPGPARNHYQAAKDKIKGKPPEEVSPERQLKTYIDIGGMAPSDLQVAAYIERLALSPLLEQVALVESVEATVDDNVLRNFKLKAKLRKEVHLTKDDVARIRSKAEKTIYNF
jgi:hypothetical protein